MPTAGLGLPQAAFSACFRLAVTVIRFVAATQELILALQCKLDKAKKQTNRLCEKDFFSFSLYPAHSKIGRGHLGLVIWHSVSIKILLLPNFSPNSGGIVYYSGGILRRKIFLQISKNFSLPFLQLITLSY